MLVGFTPRATRQVDTLRRYLSRVADPDTADRYIERILIRCLELADLPGRGRARPELGRGMRSIPFERRATILYRSRRNLIEIAAVVYGGQDLARSLRR